MKKIFFDILSISINSLPFRLYCALCVQVNCYSSFFPQHHLGRFETSLIICIKVPQDSLIAFGWFSKVPSVEICQTAPIVPPSSTTPRFWTISDPEVFVAVDGWERHPVVDPQWITSVSRVSRHVNSIVISRYIKTRVMGMDRFSLKSLIN